MFPNDRRMTRYLVSDRRLHTMTQERKQITGHMLACGTQIMWGATFVSTKVLLQYFIPVEVLFTRTVWHFWPWFPGAFIPR